LNYIYVYGEKFNNKLAGEDDGLQGWKFRQVQRELHVRVSEFGRQSESALAKSLLGVSTTATDHCNLYHCPYLCFQQSCWQAGHDPTLIDDRGYGKQKMENFRKRYKMLSISGLL
jgi:hypothetical protein